MRQVSSGDFGLLNEVVDIAVETGHGLGDGMGFGVVGDRRDPGEAWTQDAGVDLGEEEAGSPAVLGRVIASRAGDFLDQSKDT